MNRLSQTHSPYLLQHASNPVHWQPWDADALAQAKREDKPILLSIGYAACHWCHVMERESFADQQTAARMNADFVNIKVDREERPDIDRIYQSAHYLFTRRPGGWPLTMFLTPDGEPFFGGTYFPKEARAGLTAFADVLARVMAAWREKRADIRRQNAEVLPLLRQTDAPKKGGEGQDGAPIAAAIAEFGALIDRDNGGLGGAPKFPHPVELAFCLDAATRENNAELLDGVRLSLENIANGGLADHVGGGFFRYCVDANWRIPHFEKMLYDNGLLLALLADGWRAFSCERMRQAATATAEWALAEMRDSDGRFFASLDADDAGGEGAFYLWAESDLAGLLTAAERSAFAARYQLAATEGGGHLSRRPAADGGDADADDGGAAAARAAINKLAAARAGRRRPATDDKILTAWNALMIRGLARAGRLFCRDDWAAAAQTAFDAVFRMMRHGERTAAMRRGEHVGEHGFLDDCAFLLDAALELLRARFSAATLDAAETLAAELRERFEDRENGGFFFTAHDGERLVHRPKIGADGAIPAGNGVAAQALLTLSRLTGDDNWREAGCAALRAFFGSLREHPSGCASLLAALQAELRPPTIVLLFGDEAIRREWQRDLEARHDPDVLIFRPPAEGTPPPLRHPPPAAGGDAFAVVCDSDACRPPVNNLADLRKTLGRE